MKAGVLGVIDGDFRTVDSYSETVREDDHELERCLEIERVFSLPSGEMAFAGRAAAERLHERERAAIDDGEIRVDEEPRTTTVSTEFVGVPGEFAVVDSGAGEFAFDLIAAETGTTIERATLDLDSFFAGATGATPWKAGFYGTDEDAVNGIFHGRDLRRSHDLDAILADSRLNQVGLRYGYGDAEVKMTASRSGYVEVYRPTEFGPEQYLEYLGDEVLPHLTGPIPRPQVASD